MLDKGLSSPDVNLENVWIMASVCDTCPPDPIPYKAPSLCIVTKDKNGYNVPHWVCGKCMLEIQEKRKENKL